MLTGGNLTRATPDTNPVREAFLLLLGANTPRPSWDPLTALYAVRGLGERWGAHAYGRNLVDSISGNNKWDDSSATAQNQAYLSAKAPASALADEVNALLLKPPSPSSDASYMCDLPWVRRLRSMN